MLMSYNEENIYDFEQEHGNMTTSMNMKCLQVINTLRH